MASSERSARFPRILLAAPHRLAFLVGTLNVIALALWWLAQMAGLHLIPLNLPSGNLPPTLLHGPAMLYLLLPPFIFGFLMTVFPRWMGYPDLAAGQYGPVAVLLATGSLLAHSGLWLGIDAILMSGFTVFGTGWALALLVLGRLIRQNASDAKSICWHAVSAWPP
ncbi:MAG: NnrS family protein [Sphingomonadales bacterium]|nr:NnrS family protein [Sphingomonadales bacterium]